MTITEANGIITITEVVKDRLFWRQYIFHTKRTAIKMFKQELKKHYKI